MGLGRALGWLGSLAQAAIAAGMLTSAAVAALYVTSLPKFVAMALEPMSLFLMPGLVVAMAVAGRHDLAGKLVVEVSAVFYLGLFWVWFWWRGRAARQAGGSSR